MYRQATQRGLYVVDLDDGAVGHADGTVVSQLATHLRIEGGAVQNDLNLSRSINHSLGLAIN